MPKSRKNLYVFIKEETFQKLIWLIMIVLHYVKHENKKHKIYTKFPDPIKTHENSGKQVLIGQNISNI